MRRALMALAAALTLTFIGRGAEATISNVDSPDDVCASNADPCVISQPVELVDGAVLDFGTRAIQIQSSGMIDVGRGSATIRCGRLTVSVSGVAIDLVGPSPFGGDDGGLMIIEVRRRCSGNASIVCLRDSTCATASAGTCSLGFGDVSLNGRVNGNSDTPGTFILRAAGNITLSQAVQFNGQITDADGGSIEIESGVGSVTVNGPMSARAGGFSGGGDIELTGAVDVTVNDELDVTGGDFDGGIVSVTAKRDVIMTADVTAVSNSGGGFGGEIDLDAGRDLKLTGGTGSNRQTLAADGHTSFDNFAGDGGTHEYFASRDVVIGQFVRITSDGSPPDGYGDFVFITANNDASVLGDIEAVPRGDQGGGGEIEVLTFGDLQVTSTGSIDVAGTGGGGGDATLDADGQLDMDGLIDATASNGGSSGSVELDGGDKMFVRGEVTISGIKLRTFVGTIDLDACRVNLVAGSIIDNAAESGINRVTGHERVTINSGSTLRATGAGGSNRITYRTPAKPPTINGTVSPAAQLVVDATLSPCPVCGNNELDGGETCEDGNTHGGDGCSPECQDEGCIAGTPNWPNTTLCDDSDACTVDSCNTTAHTCTHFSSCDDGIACTVDGCAGTECTHTPNDSLCPSNPCGDGICNAVSGCSLVARSGPCSDGLFCNGSDQCGNGTCSVHSGDPCAAGVECKDTCDESRRSCVAPSGTPCTPDANICTSDFCNGSGQCIHPLNNGPCDDGLFCNGPDLCSGGACSVHGGNPCAALGECRSSCDEQGDACQSPLGASCSDDHNVCTVDQCDGAGGCAHAERASFGQRRLTVTRIGGANNDRLLLKAAFPLVDLTSRPSDTGFSFEVQDANGNTIYTSTVPASAIVDVGGEGKLYRYTDRDGTVTQANGLNSATLKLDAKRSAVRIKMRMRNHDVPGVVGTPNIGMSLLFGQDAGTDDCVAGTSMVCTPRGSKVICGD